MKIFNYKNVNDKFWQLIESAEGSQEKFRKVLCTLTLDELRALKREFYLVNFWTNKHAERVRNNNPDDSAFDYIQLLVVSQGYSYYKKVLENPDNLPIEVETTDSRILYWMIDEVISEKYADQLFDHTDPQNKFWKYIEGAEYKDQFYNLIWHMSLEELRAYEEEFDKADRKLDTDEHYEAMGDIRSEDTYDDTRRYVVSQGYEYYMDVLQNPEKLPQGIDDGNPKLFYGTIGRVMMDRHEDY